MAPDLPQERWYAVARELFLNFQWLLLVELGYAYAPTMLQ